MQTIYSFSYNTAIAVGSNTTGTNWRMAYQQPIMLYKGTNNTIKIIVFAPNQKVVDLTSYSVRLQIIDRETQQQFVTRTATTPAPTNGVAIITFTAEDLQNLQNRFYHAIAKLVPTNGSEEILYIDDNYGAFTPVTLEDAYSFAPTGITTDDGVSPISFTNIDQTPNSFLGAGGKTLRVNSAETALEYTTIFSGNYTDLTNKPTLFSGSYNDLTDKPAIPNLLSTGNIIPSANVTYSLGNVTNQWKDLYVSSNTIYIGGAALTISNGNLQINGNLITGGGGAGAVQPYLELTNTPFIVQNVILGPSVTITAAPAGTSAVFEMLVEEGPVLTPSILQPGINYVVGQRYIIYHYQIGAPDSAGDYSFEVTGVNETGGITAIDNIVWGGSGNLPGTYSQLSIDYLPSVIDQIDTGLSLTRDNIRGLFNIVSEQQYDNNTHTSPAGTEWNADGWGDLTNLPFRSYTTLRAVLNNAIGNNIIGKQLVMHDIANDKYYKFNFTAWGENSAGGFAYTRNLITDPNYFEKKDNGDEVDVFIEDVEGTPGIGITRAGNNSIYNPYREEGYSQNLSPLGTVWNADGWDDLSNITTRTYSTFYSAFNGGLGNKVPGSKTIMHIPENGKYYAIQWFNWTQGGNGGGFSYLRYEIDLTQLNQGIKFADGSVLKSASDFNRIKSTASGERRIEEVSGSKTVSVTSVVTTNLTALTSRAGSNTNQIWIDSTTTTIDDIINNPGSYGITDYQTIQFSFDTTNWYPFQGGTGFDGDERGFSISPNVTYGQGDTVYFRYKTGGTPQVWWDKNDLPNGGNNFRGAVIDYHAYSGEATWIGTIHIVDDSGEEHISHTEVASGSTDAENDDLWLVQNEGTISYRRIDGEPKTLKVHWTARVFYGSEFWD